MGHKAIAITSISTFFPSRCNQVNIKKKKKKPTGKIQIQNPKGWYHQGVAFNILVNLEDPAVATKLEKVNAYPNSQEG